MKKFELDKNGNPLPEAWRAVVAQLRKSLRLYPDQELDMVMARVYSKEHPCGTVHCFAGSFLLPLIEEGDFYLDYIDGIRAMDEMVGFESNPVDEFFGKLPTWARNNPEIWGNENGNLIFLSKTAFNGETNDISDIITHLESVADRQEAFNENKLNYGN